MASTATPESAKKEVFAAFEQIAKLDASGRQAAEEIFDQTLGHFFTKDRAAARWAVRRVHDYALSAVRDIAEEARRLAGRGPVGRQHIDDAAQAVIAKYRPPMQVIPRPEEGCELCCPKFVLRIEPDIRPR